MTIDIYDDCDPRDVPTYSVREAAHYLRIPPATLGSWVTGQSYETRTGTKRAEPVIHIEPGSPRMLSFWNLVEAFVLASIRRHHQVPLQRLRKALRYVQRETGLERPLISKPFLTNGLDLFVEEFGHLVNASKEGQLAMRRLLQDSLKRIDRDPKGLATGVYPWVRDPSEPKTVRIDPLVAFGRPVVIGTGIPTAVIASRLRAGEGLKSVASDYGLTDEALSSALRWELREPTN